MHNLNIKPESTVVRFAPETFAVTPNQVARYIGGSRYKLNLEIKELITAAIDQGKHLIVPRMVYAIHPVIRISPDGSLHLRNGLLLSVPHDEIDPHVKQLVAVICTIGSALEKIYRRRNPKD